ncbi:MAG: adenosylmethionine--8-amino-7-oxononanoate transaminase [Leptospiraceae bacterium]|nr:adenosylmethionine--8-amino-7-oxononanoate transaminase [Leptospiraceae bacterium]
MIWYPYTAQLGSMDPIKIVSAKGEILFTEAGEEIIDAISSWWISIHGHNHPKIIEAVREEILKLDHVLLAGFTNEKAERLADKLLEFTNKIFHRVFYSDNGSCAMEIALKIGIQYFKNLGMESKKQIIKFSLNYHGDTIGAMSISGDSIFNSSFKNQLFETKEFISPDCNNCPVGKKKISCKEECIIDLERYIVEHKNEIAVLTIEPLVFGANGMRFYKKEVLQKLCKVCKENDIIFILDEVFTGFGRTGKNFAYELAEIKPDIIAIAKGLSGGVLPIAATLVNQKVYEAFKSSDPSKVFYHGHTMTGNPSASAAALASIELYEEENRIEDVLILEFHLKKYLHEMKLRLGDTILNERVLGAIAAFELNVKKQVKSIQTIREECLSKGILIRPLGNTIYITPTYTIRKENLQKIFNVIEEVIQID